MIVIWSPMAFASPEIEQVVDPVAGALVDVHEAGLECSSGVVVSPRTADGGVEVRELRDGRVRDDDLRVTDAPAAANLAVGERVIVYRDAGGVSVFAAY